MFLEMRFLGLTLLLVCVVARDIVVDKNDERIQRYLKKYRRTSATVEKDNRPVAIPYRGRFTGGSYSYSRSRYTTGTEYDSNDLEKQEERIKQERERWQESVQRRNEQERLEEEREARERLQQQAQQRQDVTALQRQQEEQQRLERERLQQRQQQEEQQRRETERLQQQQQQQQREEQQRKERERLQQQQQQEEQQRRERERLQKLEEEQQRKAQNERADRERRHEESQRAIEQQRLERDRRAREERQRRIEIERKRREQEQRDKQEAERLKQQQEYEEAIRKQKEEYERQEKARRDEEERRKQDEANRRRAEDERKRQEEENRRREEEQRRQQVLEEERRRQQQQQQQQQRQQQPHSQTRGQTQNSGSADVNQVRATLRTELEAIVREMRNQYEHSISGKNTLAGISRQLEVLLDRLNEQMQQEPTDDTRNVKQQLEYWMRRLEQMVREDTFNCETAKREITALKDKVDYVERLIVHQGRSRGSQSRRSTTPRPPTVPDQNAEEQQPPNTLTLQRPAEVSRPWQERQQQQQQRHQQQGQHQTGHNQGSWRNNPTVDKWLPATRERYNTRMAASKRREQHMKKMKDESKRKAEQMVRGLQEADKRPWKPRRERRPSKGLTGLLDHSVANRAEVDPLDALWIEEHTAPRTIVVDSPGIKHPDWLIKQGQQRSSYTNGHRLKQINVYHQTSHDRRRTGEDARLLGDQESNVRITDYKAPQQVPPRPQSYSRQIHNTSGSCPGYVERLGQTQTVRRVTNPMIGAWMKDTAHPDPRIWAIERSNALHWDEVLEYANENDFINQRSHVRHNLPERCSGLGAVVYNGDLYCQLFAHLKKMKPTIVRIRLQGDVLLSRVELPGKQVGTKGWAGAYMTVQLSADSSGIWALFAGEDELLNIFQLDTNLNKLQGWRTTIAKDSVGPAFVVCGVMYALDSHYANSVAYIYDTALSQGRHLNSGRISMPFEDMATLHYNPTDGNLYMWTLEREENRNAGRSKFRFASRAKVYGVAKRMPIHLSRVRIHM